MIKYFIPLFLIVTISNSYSQGIGEWYVAKRNGVTQLIVKEDSTCSRDLTFDFEPKKNEFKCVKNFSSQRDTIKLGKEFLAISKSDKDTNLWKGTRILEYKKNLYQSISWSSTDTLTTNIPDLIQIHKNDTVTHFGVYLFNKFSIDSIRRLKDMSSMNKKEFRKFFSEYAGIMPKFKKALDAKKVGLAVYFYNSQLIAGILFSNGYNPFFKYETLNKLLKDYENDKVIKKLMDSIED